MADLTVTATLVVKTDGSVVEGTAGETITAGQSVYLDSATSTYKKAQANGTTTIAAARGIALNGAALNQPIIVQTSGTINPGATVTVGQLYVVSAANAGGIAPYGDLGSGHRVTVLGYGSTASAILMDVNATGIAKP